VTDAKALNAYIDESGDEGFTRLRWRARGVESASTEWLVLGAVIVPAEVDAERTAIVEELRRVLNRTNTRKPLHWRDLRNDHSRKRRAMDLLAEQRFKYSAVALHKPPMEVRASALRTKKGYLYNYASRFLVERLSWMAQDHGRKLNLYFESRATTSYSALQRYIRTLEDDDQATIHRDTIGQVRPVSPTIKGAQLADFYVSATAEALEPDLDGYTEPDYFLRIRHQLYRHPKRSVLSYGFKVFPDEAVDLERYPWMADL
jgi:hypothetical protein